MKHDWKPNPIPGKFLIARGPDGPVAVENMTCSRCGENCFGHATAEMDEIDPCRGQEGTRAPFGGVAAGLEPDTRIHIPLLYR